MAKLASYICKVIVSQRQNGCLGKSKWTSSKSKMDVLQMQRWRLIKAEVTSYKSQFYVIQRQHGCLTKAKCLVIAKWTSHKSILEILERQVGVLLKANWLIRKSKCMSYKCKQITSHEVKFEVSSMQNWRLIQAKLTSHKSNMHSINAKHDVL